MRETRKERGKRESVREIRKEWKEREREKVEWMRRSVKEKKEKETEEREKVGERVDGWEEKTKRKRKREEREMIRLMKEKNMITIIKIIIKYRIILRLDQA